MRLKDIDFSKKYHYNNRLYNRWGRRLYRFIVERILKREYKFIYVYRYDDNLFPNEEHRRLPCYEFKHWSKVVDVNAVYEAVLYDFPEFYYINIPCPIRCPDNPLVFDMSPFSDGSRYSEEEIKRFDAELDKIYHEFDEVNNGFDLELAVYRYIIKNYEYAHEGISQERHTDTEIYNGTDRERHFHEIFTVAGFLRESSAVCLGYSMLAQYIFARRGMESTVIFSSPMHDYDNCHAWCAVKLEGEWYHLDITFDDSTSGVEYVVHYGNFNITDRERIKSLPKGNYYSPADWPGIVCKSKKQNYFYRMRLYFKTVPELLERFIPFCEKNSGRKGLFRFYFRRSRNVRTKDIQAAMEALDKEKYGIDTLIYQTYYSYGVILFSYTKNS